MFGPRFELTSIGPEVPLKRTAERRPRPIGGWADVDKGCLKARNGGGDGALGLVGESWKKIRVA